MAAGRHAARSSVGTSAPVAAALEAHPRVPDVLPAHLCFVPPTSLPAMPVAPPTLTPHPNQEGWGTRSGHAGHGTLVLASFIIVGMSEAQTCLHGHVGTREAERERDTAEQWRLPLPPRRGAQLSWHTEDLQQCLPLRLQATLDLLVVLGLPPATCSSGICAHCPVQFTLYKACFGSACKVPFRTATLIALFMPCSFSPIKFCAAPSPPMKIPGAGTT